MNDDRPTARRLFQTPRIVAALILLSVGAPFLAAGWGQWRGGSRDGHVDGFDSRRSIGQRATSPLDSSVRSSAPTSAPSRNVPGGISVPRITFSKR